MVPCRLQHLHRCRRRCRCQSRCPPAVGKKHGNVNEVTDKILAALQQRKASKADSPLPLETPAAKGSEKATGKAKAKAKGKAKATATKTSKKVDKATVGVEWSRCRVQARTGHPGLGPNKSFSFEKEEDMPKAKRKAEKWLKEMGCSI